MIYLDNAGTTRISEHVLETMMPYLTEEYGNASSLHTLGQKAKEALEDARAKVAKCINALPREIYFTSGGSESDNQAILSLVQEKIKNISSQQSLNIMQFFTPLQNLKNKDMK